MLPPSRVRRTALAGLIACMLVTTVTPRAAAQPDAERQTWVRVETVQIKPERWADYWEIYRAEVVPALRKGGIQWQAAWRTAEFGSTYEVVLVTPFDDFAFFDPGDLFSRVLEPRDAERLREKLRRCIDRRTITAMRQRTDLTVGDGFRPFAIVSTLRVAPGRRPAFEEFLRDTLPGAAKAGVVFGVYERVYGDEAGWVLVQNIDSLRELAEPDPLRLALSGDGRARSGDGPGDSVTSVERRVFRYDPELSFSGGAAAAQP